MVYGTLIKRLTASELILNQYWTTDKLYCARWVEQSVRMLEGMSRPSIRAEYVKYFVSKLLFIIFIKHTETETVATSHWQSEQFLNGTSAHWQILLNQKLGYSWEGYTTPQLRALCSVSRHISQSLTSYSDHISSVCSRSCTHYSPECDWELWWA